MGVNPFFADPVKCDYCGRTCDAADEDVYPVDGRMWCGRCDGVSSCTYCEEWHDVETMTPTDDADTGPSAERVCAEPGCQDRHHDALGNALHDEHLRATFAQEVLS